MFIDRGTPSTSAVIYAGPPTSSRSPERPSSSLRVTRSIASPRSTSFTILSKMRRCASRKKSFESVTSAARLNASWWSRIATRTDRSASRLCGSVHSATASGILKIGRVKTKKAPPSSFGLLPFAFLLLSAFSDDAHLDMRRAIGVQSDRNVEVAKPFDRLRQVQLTAIDLEPLGRQRFGDVGRRDRAVQRVGLADLLGDRDIERAQAFDHRLGDLLLLGFLGHELPPLALDLFLVAFGRQQGELPRQQVVTGVAVGDLDDLASASQVVHVLTQNHLHICPLRTREIEDCRLHNAIQQSLQSSNQSSICNLQSAISIRHIRD